MESKRLSLEMQERVDRVLAGSDLLHPELRSAAQTTTKPGQEVNSRGPRRKSKKD
jgi:hypothetical protein